LRADQRTNKQSNSQPSIPNTDQLTPENPQSTRASPQQAILKMQQTQGNAAVRRFLANVQRETPAAPAEQPATTASSNTAGTPATTPSGDKPFNTNWMIDYQVLPMGQGASSIKQRKPDQTALYVEDLKVLPNGATEAQHLKGMNAADSGAVSLGSLALPNKPGNASGKIKFGAQPTLKVGVAFTEETDKKKAASFGKEKIGIEKDLKAQLATSMETLEEDKSNIGAIQARLQAEADAFVADKADDAHGYKVTVTVSPDANLGKQEAFALPTVAYPGPDADGAVYNTRVVLPTQILKGSWSSSQSGKDSASQADTKARQTSDSHKTTITKADKVSITKGTKSTMSRAFKRAWQEGKTVVDGTKVTWEFSATESMNTEGGGKFDLDVGKLIGKIPLVGKYAGKAFNWIFGGSGKLGDITGKITMGGNSGQKRTSETSKNITRSDMESEESTFQTSVEEFSNTTVEKAITEGIEQSYTVTDSDSVTTTENNEKTKSTTASVETIQYRTDAPTLEVKKQ